MKAKTSNILMEAFQRIMKQVKVCVPSQLQTVKRTGFVNTPFQALIKKPRHQWLSVSKEPWKPVCGVISQNMARVNTPDFTTDPFLQPSETSYYWEWSEDVHPNTLDEIRILDHMEQQHQRKQQLKSNKASNKHDSVSSSLHYINRMPDCVDKGFLWSTIWNCICQSANKQKDRLCLSVSWRLNYKLCKFLCSVLCRTVKRLDSPKQCSAVLIHETTVTRLFSSTKVPQKISLVYNERLIARNVSGWSWF